MLLLICVLLGLPAAVCFGGKLLRLCALRGLWLPIAALAAMPLMKYYPEISFALKALVTTLCYSCMLVFVLLNRKYLVPAILLGSGGILNYLVIAVNGFRMPISPKALEVYQNITPEAVLRQRPDYFIATGGARLMSLGDVIYMPIPVLKGFLSVGDILLSAGMFLLIVLVSRDKSIALKSKTE